MSTDILSLFRSLNIPLLTKKYGSLGEDWILRKTEGEYKIWIRKTDTFIEIADANKGGHVVADTTDEDIPNSLEEWCRQK